MSSAKWNANHKLPSTHNHKWTEREAKRILITTATKKDSAVACKRILDQVQTEIIAEIGISRTDQEKRVFEAK